MTPTSGLLSRHVMRRDHLNSHSLPARLRAREVSQERGSDDAVVRTVAAPDRARQSDGHIGLTLNQHHVGGHRADCGPMHAPWMISDDGRSESGQAEDEPKIKAALGRHIQCAYNRLTGTAPVRKPRASETLSVPWPINVQLG